MQASVNGSSSLNYVQATKQATRDLTTDALQMQLQLQTASAAFSLLQRSSPKELRNKQIFGFYYTIYHTNVKPLKP